MVQEYDESGLHTQLKYLESLFDYERAKKEKMKLLSPNGEVKKDDVESKLELPKVRSQQSQVFTVNSSKEPY